MLSGHNEQVSVATNGNNAQDDDENTQTRTRTRGGTRQALTNRGRKHIEGYNELDEMEDESDATSSGGEWEGGDDDEIDGNIVDDEEDDVDMSDSGGSEDELQHDPAVARSLIITLKYRKKQKSTFSDKLGGIQGTFAVNGDASSPGPTTFDNGQNIKPLQLEGRTATHSNTLHPKNNCIPKELPPRADLQHQFPSIKP